MNEKGCLAAGEEWLEHNLLTVAGIAVGIPFLQVRTLCLVVLLPAVVVPVHTTPPSLVNESFPQILGICFAQNLRADIFAQMAKWG